MHGCPVCVHSYPSPLSRMVNLGCRRHLPADSPLRSRNVGPYHFLDEERRPPARLRTTHLMQDCLRLLREDNLGHVCGFVGPPMFDKRVGFDWVLDSIPEPMHLFARIFVFFTNILCGGRGKSTRAKSWRDRKLDQRHRDECESLGIFPKVWPSHMQRLSNSVRQALLTPTNNDIAHMTRPFLERWLRVVGEKTDRIPVDNLRRRVMEIRQVLQQPGDYMFSPRRPTLLPWQLTRAGFEEVDQRIKVMVFPLKTEAVLYKGRSFLNSAAATSKSATKHLMLFRVLPTVLRGFVQPVRRALRFLVLGWRLLEGQVHSYNECMRLRIEPGGRSLDPNILPTAKKFMVEGLAMTTGSVPPSTLIPCLKVLVHYPDQAVILGILTW